MITSDERVAYWQCPVCRREFRNRVWPIRCCSLSAQPKLAVTEEARLLRIEDLARMTLSLIPRLPPLRRVIGIARSGMLPASILATHLGTELWSIDQHDGQLLNLRTGVRMLDVELGPGADLLIDDSAWSGRAMKACTEHCQRQGISPLRAVVIAQPSTPADAVDFYAASITPHVFSWNVTHAPWADRVAWDIDGVLCRDFRPDEDDDGPRYLEAMKSMRPTEFRSKKALHFITARLERYRAETLTWLESIGQPVASLTMGPWSSKDERDRDDVARWKAEACQSIEAIMLVDSSDYIARRVNEMTGLQTASTDSGKVYTPKQWLSERLPKIPECRHRGGQIGTEICSGCWSRGVKIETPIYQCQLHGKCHTIRVQALRSTIGEACWLCEDNDAPSSP